MGEWASAVAEGVPSEASGASDKLNAEVKELIDGSCSSFKDFSSGHDLFVGHLLMIRFR
ncbi:hypothetical protein Plhal710r2_c031g0116581 [Plasmopara halstedii]